MRSAVTIQPPNVRVHLYVLRQEVCTKPPSVALLSLRENWKDWFSHQAALSSLSDQSVEHEN